MPELPEVETVRRGLSPVMEGFTFTRVQLNRPDLRFPFADGFIDRIQDTTLTRMSSGARVTFNDPRRFGFMELIGEGEPYRLDDIGPEPMGNGFNAPDLRAKLKGKKSKIKAALLDQRIIAGLGNIYVCEALYRAGISPRRAAGRLTVAETETLVGHIKDVIQDAIAAGGSSLKDFANTEGDLGYFQHNFDVYGREGEECKSCDAPITRIVQSGRSSFYCRTCQR